MHFSNLTSSAKILVARRHTRLSTRDDVIFSGGSFHTARVSDGNQVDTLGSRINLVGESSRGTVRTVSRSWIDRVCSKSNN